MEERIIDDEYGRGIRLKKAKDGYVDVTDELAEKGEKAEETGAEYEGEEVAFEFPMLDSDEDDEELVGLTPEEAAALKKQKAEAAAFRKAEYERLCKEGEELLTTGSFKAAELKFEKALDLDEEATDASVGYWRAKTSDFAEPDVLADEYVEAGIESLEYDLGYKATDIIREKYRGAFEKRYEELLSEERPLASEVGAKQESRRAAIKARLKRSFLGFLLSAVPTAALAVLTIVLGLQNFTTRENTYILPTILCGAGFAVVFIAFILLTNKWINDMRIYRANERLSSTEEGARLEEVRDYLDLYGALLGLNAEQAEETDGTDGTENE